MSAVHFSECIYVCMYVLKLISYVRRAAYSMFTLFNALQSNFAIPISRALTWQLNFSRCHYTYVQNHWYTGINNTLKIVYYSLAV